MAPVYAWLRREIGVDVDEARARDMASEIQVAPAARVAELPAAVDELVAQAYQFPAGEAGSVTDDGWIT